VITSGLLPESYRRPLPAPRRHARLRASLDGQDEGEFTEGHELDRKWKIAKQMIGRRLSQEEARRLLANLE